MKKSTRCSFVLAIGLTVVIFAGCAQTIPREALQLSPDSLKLRQLQTRRFETDDELKLLNAGAAVFQDLGFNIDEAETRLGIIAASKSRDAHSTGQIVGAILLGVFTKSDTPIDTVQHIHVSLVTRRIRPHEMAARVTFQRVVMNSENQISRTESLEDPSLYQEFFSKLSKAVFLQANEL